jgi:hypothetical protein
MMYESDRELRGMKRDYQINKITTWTGRVGWPLIIAGILGYSAVGGELEDIQKIWLACGITVSALSWIHPYRRTQNNLEKQIAELQELKQ